MDQECSTGARCSASYNDFDEGHCIDVEGDRPATSALLADLAALGSSASIWGRPYRLPPGARFLLDFPDGDGVALPIASAVQLEGQGARIELDSTDATAIRFLRQAKRSALRDVEFRVRGESPQSDGNTATAIHILAVGVELTRVRVLRYGTGVRLQGTRGMGNANDPHWTNVVLDDCYEWGAHLDGGDTNGGLMAHVQVLGGGRGIHDDSFLGNTWVGTHLENISRCDREASPGCSNAYETTNEANYSTHVGTYLELGADAVQNGPNTLFVGGGAVRRLLNDSGERVGRGESRLRFRSRFNSRAGQFQVSIPGRRGAWSWAWRPGLDAGRCRADADCDGPPCQQHPSLCRCDRTMAGAGSAGRCPECRSDADCDGRDRCQAGFCRRRWHDVPTWTLMRDPQGPWRWQGEDPPYASVPFLVPTPNDR